MIPSELWLIPVPRLFWSEYSEQPFTHCIDCAEELTQAEYYLVQKCYVGTEPVFEFAMCNTCRDQVSGQCSEQTQQAVNAFLMEHLQKRSDTFEPQTQVDNALGKCMNECLICSGQRSQSHRYSVCGLFQGEDMVVQHNLLAQSPLMICRDCEASMSHLVSKQTRDTWDRFVEDHFDGPPGIGLDQPTGTPMLI